MAFPTVAGTDTTLSGADPVSVDLTGTGTVSAGDLLIIHGCTGTSTTHAVSGWTQLFNTASGSSRSSAWFLRAAGGETAVSVELGAAAESAWVAYRITGHHASTDPVAGTSVTDGSTTPDPPALNPGTWDVEDTLWLAVYGVDGDGAQGAPTAPTNFGNVVFAEVEFAVQAGSARRENATASEDPGTFTLTGGDDWVANTIAIRPAGAAAAAAAPNRLPVLGVS
jgi:hypothetical protein